MQFTTWEAWPWVAFYEFIILRCIIWNMSWVHIYASSKQNNFYKKTEMLFCSWKIKTSNLWSKNISYLELNVPCQLRNECHIMFFENISSIVVYRGHINIVFYFTSTIIIQLAFLLWNYLWNSNYHTSFNTKLNWIKITLCAKSSRITKEPCFEMNCTTKFLCFISQQFMFKWT